MLENFGTTRVRPRGDLTISPASDLVVVRDIPAAFTPDGRLVWDTLALHGRPEGRRRAGQVAGISGAVPDSLPPQEVVRTCDDEVVWGGFMAIHYGHFLTETAARLWPVLPGGELDGLPVVLATPVETPKVKEWLDALGHRIVDLPEQGATRFTKMYVPEPAWRLHCWIAPEVRDVHLHIRRGLEVPADRRFDAVWLSRQELAGKHRRPADEALFEWLLRDHLTAITPETMSLGEQVGMLEGSRVVAGVVGSAFHTLLMAARVPDCFYVCPQRFQTAFVGQDRLLPADGVFAPTLVRSKMVYPKVGGGGSGRLPADFRLAIPETLRAMGASVLPALRDDPTLARLAHPEALPLELAERNGQRRGLEVAVARVLADPLSLRNRMDLGMAFEAEGLARCALEQYMMLADHCANYPAAPLGVARLLHRMGEFEEASVMARRVLRVDPDSAEAASYAAGADRA